jgi:hypothetical protein
VICGSFGAPNGFRDTSPRSQAVPDIFFCRDLYFPTLVAWENRHNVSHSPIASKNLINCRIRRLVVTGLPRRMPIRHAQGRPLEFSVRGLSVRLERAFVYLRASTILIFVP